MASQVPGFLHKRFSARSIQLRNAAGFDERALSEAAASAIADGSEVGRGGKAPGLAVDGCVSNASNCATRWRTEHECSGV